MGFPNVDLFLVDKFITKFNDVQTDGGFAISDTFSDLDIGQQTEIGLYIRDKIFTKDLREREDSRVFIMPQFPMLDMPLPQIGISLGQENTSDKFLGDTENISLPVIDSEGITTHWDIQKGYLASAVYRADIVAATKSEAIWLARLVQRFICEEQEALAKIGVYSIDLTLADLKIDEWQQPLTVWNRAVQINCKVHNTWTKRIPKYPEFQFNCHHTIKLEQTTVDKFGSM